MHCSLIVVFAEQWFSTHLVLIDANKIILVLQRFITMKTLFNIRNCRIEISTQILCYSNDRQILKDQAYEETNLNFHIYKQ